MSGAAFNRLGPKARSALRRAVENALRAGLGGRQSPGQVQMQFDYALNLVETAMILDAAEAEANPERPCA